MLIDLKKVNCSYNTNNVVLSIEDLQIYENELVFFIGPSGVGKSTLLETLGLMNNTVDSYRYKKFDLAFQNKIDFKFLWNNSSLKTNYRKNYFSFIFQDDNLFDSMSVMENAISAKVIQSQNLSIIYSKALVLIGKLLYDIFDKSIDCETSLALCDSNLSDSQKIKLINQKTYQKLTIFNRLNSRSTSELSGGQKQRLSFIRAILTDFKLLFADEPTGNLDVKKAEEAIYCLKQQLVERSAIVVSHDLNLAIKFADRIIAIRKKNNKGVIDINSIFTKDKDSWNYNDKKYDDYETINILQKLM